MLYGLRSTSVAALIALGSTAGALAATVSDPVLYEDIPTGVVFDFAGFTIVGPASGPATLDIRFGQWNGPTTVIDLAFTFNGTLLAPALVSDGAYYSQPAFGSYDVSSLVTSGLNTLSVFGTDVAVPGDTTFAVGELVLNYTPESTVIPLPAGLPLLLGALGALGLVARRRQAG